MVKIYVAITLRKFITKLKFQLTFTGLKLPQLLSLNPTGRAEIYSFKQPHAYRNEIYIYIYLAVSEGGTDSLSFSLSSPLDGEYPLNVIA